jgi:multiple sugar transport system substrate-binding protein
MSSSNEAHVIKVLGPKNIAILLIIPLSLFCSITVFNPVTIINSYSQEETIKLTAIFAEPKERWDILVEKALEKLNEIYPDKNIQIEYSVLPYSDTRTQILTAMAGKSELDLVSLDQIWLGEFAEADF